MSVKVTTKDIDKGLKKIKSEVDKFKEFIVKCGILSSSNEVVDGVAVVEYAMYNELGVMSKSGGWRIPPRSFIRGWVDADFNKIRTLVTRLYSQVIDQKLDAMTALNRLGVYAKSGIQGYIRKGTFAPLSPKTVKAKGSSQPLIDTGTMRKTVNYEVVNVKAKE